MSLTNPIRPTRAQVQRRAAPERACIPSGDRLPYASGEGLR